MPSHYTITEPHPTVAQNSYTHSGRGGLGNFFRAPATTSPAGVPTPATLTTTITSSSTASAGSRRFYSGRGGAGNAHSTVERPVLSFDEEFTRAEVREKTARMGHVGRGGAGNIFASSSSSSASAEAKKSLDGEDLGRRDSNSTTGSGRSLSGFWGRVRSVGH
jgi:hypothetical protein